MTNVIHVRFPTPEERRASHIGPLLKSFASARRATTDAFWLKENGELLNILESTGADVAAEDLSVFAETYRTLPEQLAFFPQYYRFLLSLSLDLETLGIEDATDARAGAKISERLCDHVLVQDLVGGETSDIQRLEARRLLARRGYHPDIDAGVESRARAFVNAPERFALPNKKAAYELTHIVFYLTEYGRKSVDLGPNVQASLENVGIWAFLDGNADLLAEVCIAMRYLSCQATDMWESWIASELNTAEMHYAPALHQADGYHCVFMGAWLEALRGTPAFSGLDIPRPSPQRAGDALVIQPQARRSGALRELSHQLYTLGSSRSGDWDRMEPQLLGSLSAATRDRVSMASRATDGFGRFFESFARAVPA